MEIIVTSVFFMIFSLIYSKWLSEKSSKNTLILTIILFITLQKISFMIYIKGDEILTSINQILIVMLITYLKSEKNKKISVFVFANITISVASITLYFFDKLLYSKILLILTLLFSVYIFSISSHKNEFKLFNNIVIGFYFLNICINLFINNFTQNNHINYYLDLLSGVLISLIVTNSNLFLINKKNINLKKNIQISNIELEKYGERLTLNKEITKKIRKTINKKEVLLEEISDSISKCIIIIDDFEHISTKDKNFSDIWTRYQSFKGSLSLDSFLQNNILDKDKFTQALKDTKKYNKRVDIEFRDNLERYFKASFSKLTLNKNDMGVMCTIEDITYKKRAEIKIKENDIKYKKIVDNIPYSIIIVDENDIVYKNNDYIDFNKENIKRRIINSSKIDEIELLYGRENIYLSTRKSDFIDKDSKKEVIALKDITEYKNAIRDLKISKEKYRQLVDLIPEGIYTQDFEDNSLSYVNSSLFDIFSTNNIEKIDFKELNKDINITSPNKNEKIKFTRKKMKDNFDNDIYIEVGCMLIDVDKKLKIVGIIRDITEQVKSEFIEIEIEKKKAEYKIKSEFFVNISHELKTPLNVISSSNQLLEILHKEEISNNPNGIINNVVTNVKKYSNIIMGLVDNIMDLARLELNLYENNTDFYNAVSIIEDLVVEFNNYIEKNDISIIFDTDDEERIIKIDPEYIERAISILLTLIVKYSQKGSEIKVNLKEKDEGILLIQIKNEGNYDYTKYVNDRDRRSLDIGLDIVKQIINIHNSKIDIKTLKNKTIEIDIEIKLCKEIFDYKSRNKTQNNNDIYYKCLSI